MSNKAHPLSTSAAGPTQQQIEGATLLGPASAQEQADLAFVLLQYRAFIGPIPPWNFVVEIMTRADHVQCGPADQPTCGFPYQARGITDPNTPPYRSRIVPKRLLDGLDAWMQQYRPERVVVGEARKHGFKWTLAHELAHALSFKLRIGQPWRSLLASGADNLSKSWVELNSAIRNDLGGNPPTETADGVPMRPQSYPTRQSAMWSGGGYGEAFADTAAYLVLGSRYANHDEHFARRLEWVASLFEQIRRGQLSVTAAGRPI